MAKAYEISIWDPHMGKFDEFLDLIKSLRLAFLEAGVSQVDLLSGAAGKDVGKVVVIQTFKGLADNGALNESIGKSDSMVKWREAHPGDFPATLISHDLYEGFDDE
jgi:hypothetical protein